MAQEVQDENLHNEQQPSDKHVKLDLIICKSFLLGQIMLLFAVAAHAIVVCGGVCKIERPVLRVVCVQVCDRNSVQVVQLLD